MEWDHYDHLAALYAGATAAENEVFEVFALDWLRGLIPFEVGLWIDEVPADPLRRALIAHPQEATRDWDPDPCLGPLLERAWAHPGQAITAWAAGPPAAPTGDSSAATAQWLGLASRDPNLGLGRSLWLMRPAGADPFGEAEHRRIERFADHLTHAQRIGAFCHTLLRAPGRGRNSDAKQGLALVDGQGVIRHANDLFLAHARKGFPDWQPPALPSTLALPACLPACLPDACGPPFAATDSCSPPIAPVPAGGWRSAPTSAERPSPTSPKPSPR